MGGVDFVVNCVSGGGCGVEGYWWSYLDGMCLIILWLMLYGGVGVMVYMSSILVYL